MLNKFSQPSSWGGIAALIATMLPNLPPGIVQNISTVGAGVCALVAFWMNENGSKE